MNKLLKKIYNAVISYFDNRAIRFAVFKTKIAEKINIFKKRRLYSGVEWSKEQKAEFDAFWSKVYGRRIPDKWHRLYESMNGVYAEDYIPEIIFSTEVEPALDDYRYTKVLENKSMVELFTRMAGIHTPKTVIVCDDGRFYDENRKPITEQTAAEIVSEYSDIVIKPTVDSSSGKNVDIFEKGSDLKPDCRKYGRDFIVQEKIVQHPAFAAFNFSSVNTIRIITYISEGEIYHVPICFRTGRAGSHVDNIHSGGIVVGVKDNGELLSEGYELRYGNNKKKYEAHPDSGVMFKGCVLPGIPEIIAAAEKMHGYMPHVGIVSWDFTVNTDNEIVLIETNLQGQSIWFPQIVHGKGAFGDNLKAILDEAKKRRN